MGMARKLFPWQDERMSGEEVCVEAIEWYACKGIAAGQRGRRAKATRPSGRTLQLLRRPVGWASRRGRRVAVRWTPYAMGTNIVTGRCKLWPWLPWPLLDFPTRDGMLVGSPGTPRFPLILARAPCHFWAVGLPRIPTAASYVGIYASLVEGPAPGAGRRRSVAAQVLPAACRARDRDSAFYFPPRQRPICGASPSTSGDERPVVAVPASGGAPGVGGVGHGRTAWLVYLCPSGLAAGLLGCLSVLAMRCRYNYFLFSTPGSDLCGMLRVLYQLSQSRALGWTNASCSGHQRRRGGKEQVIHSARRLDRRTRTPELPYGVFTAVQNYPWAAVFFTYHIGFFFFL